MKRKILSIGGIILFSIVVIGILFWISLGREQNLGFHGSRKLVEISQKAILPLKDKFGKMDFMGADLLLFSWEDRNQGKIFKYNKEKGSVELFHDFNSFNKANEGNIIGEFFTKNNKDSTIFFMKNNASNSFRSIYRDTLLYDKKFKMTIQRIFFKDNEHSLVTTWDSSFIPEFYKYNLSTQEYSKINFDYDLIKNIHFPGVALDGVFSSDGNQIYLTSYAQNLVIIFDQEMNYKGYFRLNYKNPTFNILHTEHKKVPVIDPNNKFPNISADVENNHYYVLSSETGIREGIGVYFIDRYNLTNHKYEESVQIDVKDHEESPKQIKINQGKLYILSKKNIKIYEKDKF